jgi:hypothetical protein
MLTHGIKGKSFSEVEIKWNVFRKSRHTAD